MIYSAIFYELQHIAFRCCVRAVSLCFAVLHMLPTCSNGGAVGCRHCGLLLSSALSMSPETFDVILKYLRVHWGALLCALVYWPWNKMWFGMSDIRAGRISGEQDEVI